MRRLISSLAVLVVAACTNQQVAQAETKPANSVKATWYQCCKRTANGERFNPDGLTAAHRTLPFNTKVKVTYKGKSTVVRINDRGPFRKGYSIDLSRGAARKIGMLGSGTIQMQILK